MEPTPQRLPRRGAFSAPPNRFEAIRCELDLEQIEQIDEILHVPPRKTINYLPDLSRSIVSENNSPDVPFKYSLNPYRGCLHGCAYCYARPTHEYLGFDAGVGFETEIMVKHEAAELLNRWLARGPWQGEDMLCLSGVTDCYQPCERQFRLTRQCLEVMAKAVQPVAIVTKNALVVRDLDLISHLAARQAIHVNVSVTTLDPAIARHLEPRTSTPAARLRAISRLSQAGVPVGVMVAPIIPGITDHELPSILQAAAEAGATYASYIILRLPLTVEPLFREWLDRVVPAQAEKVISRIKSLRQGQTNDSTFGVRMRGTGPMAEQIAQTFRVFAARQRLETQFPQLCSDHFVKPTIAGQQRRLFQ